MATTTERKPGVAYTPDYENLGPVKIEVEFLVKDPALLLSKWAQLPYSKEYLFDNAENPLNWAQALLDVMVERLDEQEVGVEFHASTCSANPTLT